jgi:hypothetical protein
LLPEQIRNHELKNRIAEEFQALIMTRLLGLTAAMATLVGLRTMA